MEDLSASEMRVIRVLLSGDYRTDRESYALAAVPRSTFQSIRRRSLGLGWTSERWIPHPLLVQRDSISFRIVQPFAESRREVTLGLLSGRPSLLWTSHDAIFSMSYVTSLENRSRVALVSKSLRFDWRLDVPVSSGGIITFFDYEGFWSRWALRSAPISYPRSFKPVQFSSRSSDSKELRGLSRDVGRYISAREPSVEPGLGLITRLPRPRLLDDALLDGAVLRRGMPNFNRMPPVHGKRVADLVAVLGVPRGLTSGSDLFECLTRDAHMAPHTYAWSREGLILMGLGTGEILKDQSAEPVINILRRFLEKIVVLRIPLGSMTQIVDHQYGHLFSSSV